MKETMQIILIQTDIEQAIKDFINQKVTISPDNEIKIDFSPTRGSEGIKAIIDLVPKQETVTRGQVGRPRKTATVETGVDPKEKPHTTSPAPAVEVETEKTSQDITDSDGPQTEVVDPEENAPQENSVEEETKEEAPPATPPVKSLFQNLRKPQNV